MAKYLLDQEHTFWGKLSPNELIQKYQSPLYVYNEEILRARCRQMKNLINLPEFIPSYSLKANPNLSLLKIVLEEGLNVDTTSVGEIAIAEKAGFKHHQIAYIPNNVAKEELSIGISKGLLISLDSTAQLELFGKINPHSECCIRINPGIGAGHHEKVVTAGTKTKFGIALDQIPEVQKILAQYDLKLTAITQHIGSLFMEPEPYLAAVDNFLEIARKFQDLKLIDFGGGFGIPYHKSEGEKPLDLDFLGKALQKKCEDFIQNYGRTVKFKIEPGRFIVAESGVLLGQVTALKSNANIKYIGTDIGFNVLMRPVLYDSHHDILVYRDNQLLEKLVDTYHVVGNICESGDVLAHDRKLPEVKIDDCLALADAGAYGYAMASNYNNRLRPAEVLIDSKGKDHLIRRRETIDDLFATFIF